MTDDRDDDAPGFEPADEYEPDEPAGWRTPDDRLDDLEAEVKAMRVGLEGMAAAMSKLAEVTPAIAQIAETLVTVDQMAETLTAVGKWMEAMTPLLGAVERLAAAVANAEADTEKGA